MSDAPQPLREIADAERGRRVVSICEGASDRQPRRTDEDLMDQLMSAARSGERGALTRARAALHRAGHCDEVIAQRFVPEVARRFGQAWVDDTLSFTDVSIATAWLQRMLRQLDSEPPAMTQPEPYAPAALMIIPAGEYHTLGAMVATGQLRKMGLSVRLSAGQSTRAVCDMVLSDDFDMILVSWARSDRLDSLHALILKIRDALPRPTPIVVGGAVLATARQIERQTGADYATSDIEEAVRLCGLTDQFQPAGARVTGA